MASAKNGKRSVGGTFGAKRLECVQLAGAFAGCRMGPRREQAPCTPNPSRSSVAAKLSSRAHPNWNSDQIPSSIALARIGPHKLNNVEPCPASQDKAHPCRTETCAED